MLRGLESLEVLPFCCSSAGLEPDVVGVANLTDLAPGDLDGLLVPSAGLKADFVGVVGLAELAAAAPEHLSSVFSGL